MTYKESKSYFFDTLHTQYDAVELDEIMHRAFTHVSGKTKLELITDKTSLFDVAILNSIIHQLKAEKPIQYILSYEWFGHLKLNVNEAVLIPRPETEELCKWVLDYIQTINNPHLQFLDIGTGSGCIPIYVGSKNNSITLHALDYSEEALFVAQQNAVTHNIPISFLHMDILQPDISAFPNMDIIVSNPPYITLEEKTQLQQRVIAFEPHEALFVTNNDPLQFYKAILSFASQKLKPNACIFLEVHQDFALETEKLFKEQGYYTELRKDMYGNERMLKATSNHIGT